MGRREGPSEGLPDVVYLLRDGDLNEELRHSLRSLKNLPHARVWLAGFQPSWTANVGRVPAVNVRDKHASQALNLKAVCEHPDVSDSFVLFNDDFFVLKKLGRVPVWHRGPFRDLLPRHRGGTRFSTRMRATAEHLGVDALCYDSIHTPLPVDKTVMVEVLNDVGTGLLFRSVYANRVRLGGRRHGDVKVRGRGVPGGMLCSTSDGSFQSRPVGEMLRARFSKPSRYEQ